MLHTVSGIPLVVDDQRIVMSYDHCPIHILPFSMGLRILNRSMRKKLLSNLLAVAMNPGDLLALNITMYSPCPVADQRSLNITPIGFLSNEFLS